MSQATVRAALMAFLSDPAANLPGTPTVLPEWPTEFDAAMFDEVAGQEYTSVIGIHLRESSETRISLPALTGSKGREHTVGLLIFYQYMKPAYPPVGQPYNTAWVDGLDATFDALIARIRSDPNGGNPAVIWQMGQDQSDLVINRDLPTDNGTTIISWNTLELKLTEIVQA